MLVQWSFALMTSLLWVCTASAGAGKTIDASKVSDTVLVSLLNNVEVVGERFDPKHGTVRIFSVAEQHECDGAPTTCPKVKLFVAVSEIERPGFQGLFDLGEAFGWRFLGWQDPLMTSNPSSLEDTYFLRFRIERKLAAQDTASRWWTTQICVVRANPWKAEASCE